MVARPPRRKPLNGFEPLPPRLPNSMRKDSARRLSTTSFPCTLVQLVSTCFASALSQKRKPRPLTLRSLSFGHSSSNTTSPPRCSLYLLKLGGLGVGSAVQRHAAAPWRVWQSVIPTLMAATQSPDTDTLFISAPRLRAQLVQLQMKLPAFLLKPLGAALRQNVTQKKLVSSIQQHFKQLRESLTTSPIDRAVLLSQSAPHTGAHLMQSCSEAYKAEDRCFRVAVASGPVFPHPAVTDPSVLLRATFVANR